MLLFYCHFRKENLVWSTLIGRNKSDYWKIRYIGARKIRYIGGYVYKYRWHETVNWLGWGGRRSAHCRRCGQGVVGTLVLEVIRVSPYSPYDGTGVPYYGGFKGFNSWEDLLDSDLHVSDTLGYSGDLETVAGTGKPKNRDDVQRTEVWVSVWSRSCRHSMNIQMVLFIMKRQTES
jgi:hypothetical protein